MFTRDFMDLNSPLASTCLMAASDFKMDLIQRYSEFHLVDTDWARAHGRACSERC